MRARYIQIIVHSHSSFVFFESLSFLGVVTSISNLLYTTSFRSQCISQMISLMLPLCYRYLVLVMQVIILVAPLIRSNFIRVAAKCCIKAINKSNDKLTKFKINSESDFIAVWTRKRHIRGTRSLDDQENERVEQRLQPGGWGIAINLNHCWVCFRVRERESNQSGDYNQSEPLLRYHIGRS